MTWNDDPLRLTAPQLCALALGILGLVLVLLSSGCAYGPNQVPWNGSWLSRIVSGDLPRTPDEAQAALDEITRQVQQLETVPRAACAVACAGGACPPACVQAEALRIKLVALRGLFQIGIDTWRADGGDASAATTDAFLGLVRARRPELVALVDVLRAWRGESVPTGGPIVPAAPGA